MAKKKTKAASRAKKGQIHQLRTDHPNILPLMAVLLITLLIYFYIAASV